MVLPKLRYRLGLLVCLYCSQGIPFGFFSHALPPLLRSYGVDLKDIGFISLLAAPWALKFIWAPYVDQLGWQSLGHRKSWIVPMQVANVSVLLLIGLLNPQAIAGSTLYLLLFLLFLANWFAATQDIATDGLAVQILSPNERGLGNGVQVGAYRVGMVMGGGLVLVLIERTGWVGAFGGMAVCLMLLTVPVLLFKEPEYYPVAGKAGPANLWQLTTRFMRQKNMFYWILVVLCYKAADSFGSAMTKPMLVDQGISLEQIGWLSGVVGMISGIVGALFGGYLIPRVGRERALFYFGLVQAMSLLGYLYLAINPSVGFMVIAVVIGVEHFVGGMATAALFTLMMDACRPQVAGTDYTVQASIQVIVGGVLHAASGMFAQTFGYASHFGAAVVLGVLVLLPVILWARNLPEQQAVSWKNHLQQR